MGGGGLPNDEFVDFYAQLILLQDALCTRDRARVPAKLWLASARRRCDCDCFCHCQPQRPASDGVWLPPRAMV